MTGNGRASYSVWPLWNRCEVSCLELVEAGGDRTPRS